MSVELKMVLILQSDAGWPLNGQEAGRLSILELT